MRGKENMSPAWATTPQGLPGAALHHTHKAPRGSYHTDTPEPPWGCLALHWGVTWSVPVPLTFGLTACATSRTPRCTQSALAHPLHPERPSTPRTRSTQTLLLTLPTVTSHCVCPYQAWSGLAFATLLGLPGATRLARGTSTLLLHRVGLLHRVALLYRPAWPRRLFVNSSELSSVPLPCAPRPF